VDCQDFLTPDEKEFVKKHGCFSCDDCIVPYRIKMRNPQEQYQKRKALGLCVNCGARPAQTRCVTCEHCASVSRVRGRAWTKQLREGVIKAYGGKCSCCGETPIEFLTIDHINGRGSKEHLYQQLRGHTLYKWLRDNQYPKDNFRLLCRNCNGALGQYGYCPHNNK